MVFLFKNYSLVKVTDLLIWCYETRFFLSNTNNTDRNDVNKQNTHTHTHTHTPNTQRKIILDRFSIQISDIPFFETTPLFYSEPLPFFRKFSKLYPLPLYKRREGSNYDTVKFTTIFLISLTTWTWTSLLMFVDVIKISPLIALIPQKFDYQ